MGPSSHLRKENALPPRIESTETPDHEELLSLISQLDFSEINTVFPIRESEELKVYSEDCEGYLNIVEEVLRKFKERHTVTRAGLLDRRTPYSGRAFFITKDGFLIDRKKGLIELVKMFEVFALEYRHQYNEVTKTSVDRYNLKLTGYLVADMLSFIKAFNVENRSLSRD